MLALLLLLLLRGAARLSWCFFLAMAFLGARTSLIMAARMRCLCCFCFCSCCWGWQLGLLASWPELGATSSDAAAVAGWA
jgi:hypothetical protein